MKIKDFITIFNKAKEQALKKINNNKNFYTVLSIQYTIEDIIKKKKKK